ncbi:MAG: hypothetical protein F6K40_09485 [Okeania sp. SIO3I5]|uniref:tectonin domain-containing protein n=1 Tax=Okeania sp. SIO3I5 TaxID=2607805 RepID=UPI0013BB6659|nr:tectonin domain-containing protein [Okeania sp. SIO3I5]NEQ36495.1 hypothetical protein [Okeania sp. SIO3I5]
MMRIKFKHLANTLVTFVFFVAITMISAIPAEVSSLVWTVNSKGEVWTLDEQGGGKLYSTTGFAGDIGVGADGTVWTITTQPQVGEGGNIPAWLSDPETSKWTKLGSPAAAIRIAVGPDGIAWTVNSKGEVWTLNKPSGGGLLYSSPGFAKDIGVGADGTVWVVTTEPQVGGGGNILAWLSEPNKGAWGWTKLGSPAAAIRIAVGPDGTAWTVNSKGEVWTLNKPAGGGLRYSSPGFAKDIGVGVDGTVWVVTTEPQVGQAGNVLAWLSEPNKGAWGWTKLSSPAAAIRIAVGSD